MMYAVQDVAAGADWNRLFGTGVSVTAAGAIILGLGKMLLWSQWQVVKHESAEKKALLERLDEQEAKQERREERSEQRETELRRMYDASMEAHRHCEAELAQHKIDHGRELAAMQARIDELDRLVNRPRRRDDPD